MKKTKFFYLMAAAALMTACSSEDALKENLLSSVDLSNRVEIGSVELSVGSAASSRASLTDGKYGFAETYKKDDAIGAVLIDELAATAPTGAKVQWGSDQKINGVTIKKNTDISYADYKLGFQVKDPSAYYTVTDGQIWTNYKYLHSGTGFNTEATLVEGNYMFYSPFNGDVQTRGAMEVFFPTTQDCSKKEMRIASYWGKDVDASCKALSDLYSGAKADVISSIGYQFLPKAAKGSKIKPNVAMNYLYSQPMFTIKNNFKGVLVGDNAAAGKFSAFAGGDIKVEKVVIYHDVAASNLFSSAFLLNSEVANINTNWTTAKTLQADTKTFTGQVLTGQVQPTAALAGLDASKVGSFPTVANYVTCVINETIAEGKEYHFHAVLPAGDYGKGDLKALVYVEIGGKHYVMSEAQQVNTNASSHLNFAVAPAVTPHSFIDAAHGGQPCVLLRGYNVPAAELKVYEDATQAGKKAFAGEMLTIDLNGVAPSGKSAATKTIWAAFQLNETAAPTGDYGFVTNQDFIDFMSDYVQRGETLVEDPATTAGSTRTKSDKNKWGTKIAFATKGCEVVINGSLIDAMKNWMELDATTGNYMTLTTNLPIDNTVTVSDPVSGTYTFKSMASGKTYDIQFTAPNSALKSNKLQAGITHLTAGTEVKGANAQGVLFLEGAGNTYTISGTDNKISEIHVATGVKVVVNCDLANTRVIAKGATIEIGTKGNLANGTNSIDGCTITNDYLNTIAGTINGKGQAYSTVVVNLGAWPATALPKASKVNAVNIAPTVGTVLTIDNAQVNMFSQLDNGNVAVTLSNNITAVISSADVTLSKIASITKIGTAINWNSTMIALTVYGNSASAKTAISGIAPDASVVTFDSATTK